MIDPQQLIPLGPFVKGVNNITRETALGPDELRQADNVSIDTTGLIALREGFTEVVTGSGLRSLYAWQDSLLFVEDGTLTRFNPIDVTKLPVLSGLNQNRYVSYAGVNGWLYWTNGEQSGKLSAKWENRPWGVPTPPTQPRLTASADGALPAANYQVAITFVDDLGEESGTGVAAQVSSGGGIVLLDIPQPGSGKFIRIYMTPPNGDVFYEQAQVQNGVTSYTIYAFQNSGIPLETQFMKPMPPGQIVRFAFGRLWVARDNMLFFSASLRPGTHNPMDNYFRFKDRITVMEPISDGIWVTTTTETRWIPGADPEQMTNIFVASVGGVEGTGTTVHASKFNIELPTDVAYWFGDQGAVIGMPQGQIKPFMEGRVAVEKFRSGATMLREENGLQQVITALSDNSMQDRVRITDSAVGYIRRNGIIIG